MPEERRPSSSSPVRGVIGFGGDYYRLAFEHAGVSMVATHANLDIRSWNAAAARMFGAAAGRMIGTSLLAVIPQEGRADAERTLHKAVNEGVTSQFEFVHRDSQGQARQLAVTVSPIPNRQGERVGALACFRDITNRMKLAEELAQHRKMVSLGEMAGALAQHFNNILGGIVTSVDYALGASDPDVRLRVLQKTAQALERATRLVNGLLSFAEGDRRAGDMGDITEAVVQTLDRMEKELKEQDIETRLELEPIPARPVYRRQIDTVLLNLIQNAMDAMPDGGTLTVSVKPVDKQISLDVADTGCGMDEEQLTRIFEPFYSRPHSDRGSRRRHEGLGLAVVHGIITDLGGSVAVTSKPGHGTTFSIRIPAAAV